jgi:competence protein ComEA
MNKYLAASVLPLALIGSLSYASVKAEAHTHRKASLQHVSAVTKVNINTANATQLSNLKGIGTKRAQAIVTYRKAHGPFSNVKALSAVKGIGDKKVIAIQKQGFAYTTRSDKP